jgi:predicted amidohydrolase YtcJ
MQGASIVLRNVCLEPFDSGADTVVIEGQYITAVDSWDQLKDALPKTANFYDCAGKTLLPGIDDSHLHAYLLGRQLFEVNVGPDRCADAQSIKIALKSVQDKYSGWIRGHGWVGGRILGSGPGSTVAAADLDDAELVKPIVLSDFSAHQAWCNSLALQLAGITRETPDPSGGVIVRYADGTPTGLLVDSAVALVTNLIPKPSQTQRLDALRAARDLLLSYGITSLTEPGIGPGASSLGDGSADLVLIDDYKKLAADNELNLRVNIMLLFGGLGGTTVNNVEEGLDNFGAPEFSDQPNLVNVSQLKIFADGIPGSRTAWMSEPYDNHGHGSLTLAGDTDAERLETLKGIFAAASKRGWQMGFHATGDATTSALIELLLQNRSQADKRHYVIHGDFIRDEDVARMSESGLFLTSQPSIRWFVSRNVDSIIGAERSSKRQQLRSLIEAKVPVSLSSDAPVSTPDWKLTYAAAVSRSLRTEPEYTDNQKLTPLQALTAMTQTPAKQSGADAWRGRIEPGFVADLLLVDRKIDFAADPWSLKESNVQATFVDGRLVFGEL